MRPSILVIGFKPFLGGAVNPSQILALELAETNSNVEALILPVEFGNSFEILKNHLKANKMPDYLVMIGQAAQRKKVCLEKIGLNWMQSENKDETGFLPKASALIANAPIALESIFPIEKCYLELLKSEEPVEVSFSAGTFVCNEVYFKAMYEFKNLKSIFVHVPVFETLAQPQQGMILKKIIIFLNHLESA
jgi:pyroglutamyl-peptidase